MKELKNKQAIVKDKYKSEILSDKILLHKLSFSLLHATAEYSI